VAYVTPLVVIFAYFHVTHSATVTRSVQDHLKSVAENERNTVDLFLQERVANLRNVFAGHDMHPLPSREAMVDALAGLRSESPTFVDLGLFDARGVLVAYAGPHPSLEGKHYDEETWYRRLHDEKRSHVISDVFLGFRNKPHFVIALRHVVGGQAWTVRASVDPEKFGEFVQGSHLVEEAEAFIVNGQGERQSLSANLERDPEISLVGRREAEIRVTEIEARGTRYVRAVAWLSEHEWAVVVRIPMDRAYAALLHARVGAVAIMLATLVFIVVVVVRSTRRLVARLEAADEAKETLRQHLFDAAKLASVGEMAAGVAHEINNPLAIIHEEAAMMTDLLDPQFNQRAEPDELRERLAAIRDATMRGRDVTRKLLAFARQHEHEPRSVDVHALIDRVVDVKAQDFRVSDIEVVRRYGAGLPHVAVNPNQIEQVFLNLLNNARDAIGRDGRVTVTTEAVAGGVRVDVADTGCGMSQDVLARIFFPFFTTKPVGKGTGLGLSISYGIIQALGGRIEAESAPGLGTTFRIYLPAAAQSETSAAVG